MDKQLYSPFFYCCWPTVAINNIKVFGVATEMQQWVLEVQNISYYWQQ